MRRIRKTAVTNSLHENPLFSFFLLTYFSPSSFFLQLQPIVVIIPIVALILIRASGAISTASAIAHTIIEPYDRPYDRPSDRPSDRPYDQELDRRSDRLYGLAF